MVSLETPLTTRTVEGGHDMARTKPTKSIIQCQLKLKLRPAQERMLNRWLWHLTAVFNWAYKTVEHNANQGIYLSRYDLESRLAFHSGRMGIPARVLDGAARTAHDAWQRCFQRLARRPRMKGRRNRLNSILFRQVINRVECDRIFVSGFGMVRFHRQEIPAGRITGARLIRRSSGWYFSLFVEASPRSIPVLSSGEIGIDPGFVSLISLSTGEKVEQALELKQTAMRLAQSQRGSDRRLTARLKEREANQRKDRNHKLSRRLLSENALICWSKDSHRAIARTFGKSVASAAHGQLRQMLAYKCRAGGREFIEVPNRYSTMTCSACGARSGPTGYAGLSVRQWTCGCGASWDRDVNAALNTLIAGRGLRLERVGDGSSGIVT